MLLRVLIADDHAVVREGLRSFLAQRGDAVTVADACNGREAIETAAQIRPHLVIMDVRMPETNGIDAARQILLGAAGVDVPRILMFSTTAEPGVVSEAIKAGANGYLTKDCTLAELGVAIDRVLAGDDYFAAAITGRVLRAVVGGDGGPGHRVPDQWTLSPREREVLTLLAQGQTSKEIALHLGISRKTVETHRAQIMTKLDLRSIAELTRFAIHEGLVDLDGRNERHAIAKGCTPPWREPTILTTHQ